MHDHPLSLFLLFDLELCSETLNSVFLSDYSETTSCSSAPSMALFDEQPSELSDELLSFLESSDSYPLDDIFFTKTDHLQPAFHHHPSFSDPSYTPREPVDLYRRHAKRPKSCNDLHKPVELMFEANSYNAVITESEIGERGSVIRREWSSAQSVAARDRRKRISEKTQELARLIPGGNKMNTSEMLQAAFTYVKFLQAQVSVLALMQSFESLKVSMVVEEQLQVLLSSISMQQRLASESKCIIPIEFVEFLVKEEVVENSFKRFIETIGL